MSRRVIGVVPDKDGKETKEEWATRMIKDWDITEPMYWTRKKKRDPFEEEEERLRSGHEGGQKQDRQLSTNDTSRKYRLPIKALGRRVWNRVVKQSQNSHNAQMSRRAREVVPYKDGKETDAEWATRMIKDWDITEPMYWTRKKKYDPFEDAEKKD